MLYGFCRHVDDLADELEPARAREELGQVRRDLASGESDAPEVAGFLALARERNFDPSVTDEFIAGVEQDLAPAVYRSEEQLVRYCYRVAGTVGLYMCALLEVDEPEALPFALDLGIGMQLTNISRDVLEDAARGRVYLPSSLTDGTLDPAGLVGGDPLALARARGGVEALLDLAEGYYRSADRGMAYLPRRARMAVLAASRRYEAIGPRIRRAEARTLPERAYVAGPAKYWHLARGLGAALGTEMAAIVAGHRPHQADLHGALVGLPGADPAL